jgi:hypothetical protein
MNISIMTHQRTSFLLILILTSCLKMAAQVAPPEMAMPTDSNTLLIDKIIEVTNHEKYFNDYCNGKVMAYAQEHNWKKDKTSEILKQRKIQVLQFDNL